MSEQPTRAAILRRLDSGDSLPTLKVVVMKPGQSEDFDRETATRKWLWPHLNGTHCLQAFVDIEFQQ